VNENYYYLFIANTFDPSVIPTLFNEFGCLGLEELSLNEAQVDEFLGEESFCGGNLSSENILKLESEQLKVNQGQKLFFDNFESAKNCEIFLSEKLGISSTLETKINEDWNESWKSSYETIELLEGKIKIIPSWDKLDGGPNCKGEVFIYPGQGFGTGTHGTTQLCMEIFNGLISEQFSNILDFGCGSGILGIYAQKNMEESFVDYFDIDQGAIDNTAVNLELNSVGNNFSLLIGDDQKGQKDYQLVFANILLPVLIEESGYLTQVANKFLIISGILIEQEKEVLSYYPQFSVVQKISRGDWLAILLKRK
jgi:ribosomal protein L11 methyltransferase